MKINILLYHKKFDVIQNLISIICRNNEVIPLQKNEVIPVQMSICCSGLKEETFSIDRIH